MEAPERDDLLVVYKDMAKYDFTKPLNVSVTINEVDCCHQEEEHKSQERSKTRKHRDNKRTADISSLFNQNPVHISMSNNLQINVDYTMQSPTLESSTVNYILLNVGGLPENHKINTNLANDMNETTRLLNIVSKNLIRILQADFYYLHIINNSGTNYVQITVAKRKYLDTKMYYFNLSRDIAIRELLPQRHNTYFVRTFIDRTKQIALTTYKFNCLEKDLQDVFNELMIWIMPKTYNQPQPQNTAPISHVPVGTLYDAPQYNAQLYKNLQNDRYSHDIHPINMKIPNQTSDQNPKTCFFTYSSPGHEIGVNDSRLTISNSINKQQEINSSQRNDTSNVIDIVTRQDNTTNILDTTRQIPRQDASRLIDHSHIR